ncbi:MAG TPA: TetR/AcrR family transcriptional regulator [Acidimicrobiia bacterium]
MSAGRSSGARSASGRIQIIDAAIASIQDIGIYRSSTNEIARRAEVSWGALQYHFGTREKLMLAVLQELDRRFLEHVNASKVEGDTMEARLTSLYDILGRRYDSPVWLVRFQILLDLQHDPDTSADAMAEVAAHAKKAQASVQRLLREAIGGAPSRAQTDELLHAVRGFAISQQVSRAIPIPGERRAPGEAVRRYLHGLALAYEADAG